MISKDDKSTKGRFQPEFHFWDNQFSKNVNTSLFKNINTSDNNNSWDSQNVFIDKEMLLDLHKYTKGDDLAIFVLVSSALFYIIRSLSGENTLRVDTPKLIKTGSVESGYVPLVVETQNCSTLRELISESKNIISKSYSYQSVDFEKFYTSESSKTNIGLKYEGLHNNTQNGEYNFFITFNKKDQLEIKVEYNKNFSQENINTICKGLIKVLKQYNDLEKPLIELDILTEEQQNELINNGRSSNLYLQDSSFLDVFCKKTETLPDHVIITQGDKSMTYAMLNKEANKLAHFLIEKHQAGKNSRVGVICDKSLDSIIALLAIMKIGAMYVPINPSNPIERVEYIIKDAEVSLLLIHSAYLKLLTSFYKIPMIGLDFQLKALTTSETNPLPHFANSELKYLIYTSGSTNLPKGVVCNCSGVMKASSIYINEFSLDKKDAYLQFLSLAFDGSMLDIFSALLSGAHLHLPADGTLDTSESFINYVNERQISVSVLTPSIVRNLKSADTKLTSLQTLVFAGEKLIAEDVKGIDFANYLYNAYGPTEASVVSTLYKVERNQIKGDIPIGNSIAGKTIVILNEQNKICPIGVTGQICISGSGLAEGYLNNPELTSNKFILNPFGEGKLYLTGDLGFWDNNGNVHFIGREDNQVKVNGYRVSLSEIEHALNSMKEIKSAIVIKDEDILKAFLIGEYLEKEELRSELNHKIPQYMIPHHFFFIDVFPLDKNGKTHTKKLMEICKEDIQTDYKLPETKNEEILAEIWSKVLDNELKGVEDNFFELGGNSLKAMQVLTQIQNAFKIRLTVDQLFSNPTVRQIAQFIEEKAKDISKDKELDLIEEQDHYYLTEPQKQIWIQNEIMQNAAAYNMANAHYIEGNLDVNAFIAAIHRLMASHENLRSLFVAHEGIPVQKILDIKSVQEPVNFLDLTKEGKSSKDFVDTLLNQAVQKEFDLTSKPPFEVTLIKEKKERYVLLINMHHIIADGWSLQVLFSQLISSYKKITRGDQTDSFEQLSFKDANAWYKKKILDTDEHSKQYWQKQLDGANHHLNLPIKRTGERNNENFGNQKKLRFNEELCANIFKLRTQEKVSNFTFLFSVANLLLGQYANQRDILVGSTIAERNYSALKDQIGFFLNTVLLRHTLDPEETFLSFLNRVNESVKLSFKHQNYPVQQLMKEMKISRKDSFSPLFNVLVESVDTNAGLEFEDVDNLIINPAPLNFPYTKYDITFKFFEEKGEDNIPGRMGVTIEYDKNLFEDEMIDQMLRHFETLVSNIVEKPKIQLKSITCLSDKELNELYEDQTNESTEADKLVIETIAEKANKYANCTALRYKNKEWTYEKLGNSSDAIANYLLSGVDKGTVVGVMMQNSPELIASLIGILKAGMTFVCIDPDWPKKRKMHIWNEAEVSWLFTQSSFILDIDDYEGQVVAVDVQWDEILKYQTGNVERKTNLHEDIAYICYTSGTTGQPKGVLVSHESLSNYMNWANEFYFGNHPEYNFVLFTSPSFDLTLTSIFTTLARGGVITVNDLEDIDKAIKGIFESDAINTVKLTPSHINILASLPIQKTKVNKVIAGGEPLLSHHINLLRSLNPQIQIYNEYGPTEATIGCSAALIIDELDISIGTPIENTKMIVLNEFGQIQPIGVTGELYIGGRNLSKGYLKDDLLTNSKFVEVLFQGKKERFYRSGDLAFLRDDGTFQYVGRVNDDQVQFNGYRIELSEIENTLINHPAILNAVVIHKREGLNSTLICFYVGELFIEQDELINYLSKFIPKYMVPRIYYKIDEIPQTSNFKIDRKKLLQQAANNTKKEIVEPKTPTQIELHNIWVEILGTNAFGIYENFFEIGGNSFLAIQCYLKINEVFEKKINVTQIYSYPTIEKLSKILAVESELRENSIKVINL